jgi:hypothetical protein
VDEEEVEVVAVQRGQRLLEGPAGIVGPVETVAELAGDEDVGPGEPAGADGLADLALVAVHLGGVDVAVADVEGFADGADGVLRIDLEDAEARAAGSSDRR